MHNIERKEAQLFGEFRQKVYNSIGRSYWKVVSKTVADWNLTSPSKMESEFLAEYFAGSRLNLMELTEAQLYDRDTLVDELRDKLAKKHNIKGDLRYSLKDAENRELKTENKILRAQREEYYEGMNEANKQAQKSIKQGAKIEDARHAAMNRILDSVRIAKDIEKRKYITDAGALSDPTINEFVKTIASLHRQGSSKIVSADLIREKMQVLAKIYRKDNPLFLTENDLESDKSGLDSDFDENLAESINNLTKSKDEFTVDDLQDLERVVKGILHLYKIYDTFVRNGKSESITKAAESGLMTVSRTVEMRRKQGSCYFPL
jgi:hypothetical protein